MSNTLIEEVDFDDAIEAGSLCDAGCLDSTAPRATNAIEAGSLCRTGSLKRSTFEHAIEAGSLVTQVILNPLDCSTSYERH